MAKYLNKEATLYAGIDTIQINSKTESEVDADFLSISPERTKRSELWKYRLNPDKAYGETVFTLSEYFKMKNKMILELQLEDPQTVRIDYRFDSIEIDFDNIAKFYRCFLLLLARTLHIDNTMGIYDLRLRTWDKSLKIVNERYEVEAYNKLLQEPNGKVTARIEFRIKKLYDFDIPDGMTVEEYGLRKWYEKIQEAIMTKNIVKFVKEQNDLLFLEYQTQKFQRPKFTVSQFIDNYKTDFFLEEQLIDFLERYSEYTDVKQQARRIKSRYKIELYHKKDFLNFFEKVYDSGNKYLGC